jgi:hypothetical protein
MSERLLVSRWVMRLLDRRSGCIAFAAPLRAPLILIPSVFLPTVCGRTLGAIRTSTSATSCGATISVTTSHPPGTDEASRTDWEHADGATVTTILIGGCSSATLAGELALTKQGREVLAVASQGGGKRRAIGQSSPSAATRYRAATSSVTPTAGARLHLLARQRSRSAAGQGADQGRGAPHRRQTWRGCRSCWGREIATPDYKARDSRRPSPDRPAADMPPRAFSHSLGQQRPLRLWEPMGQPIRGTAVGIALVPSGEAPMKRFPTGPRRDR